MWVLNLVLGCHLHIPGVNFKHVINLIIISNDG